MLVPHTCPSSPRKWPGTFTLSSEIKEPFDSCVVFKIAAVSEDLRKYSCRAFCNTHTCELDRNDAFLLE